MAKRPYRLVVLGDGIGYYVKGNLTDWFGQVPNNKTTAEYWQAAGYNTNPQLATYGSYWQPRGSASQPYNPASWAPGFVIDTEDFEATIEITGQLAPRIVTSKNPQLVGTKITLDLAHSLRRGLELQTVSMQGHSLFLEGVWHWDLSPSTHGTPTLRLV